MFLKNNSSLYDPRTKTAKDISWNFGKFLVDSNSKVIKYYEPQFEPKNIVPDIQRLI